MNKIIQFAIDNWLVLSGAIGSVGVFWQGLKVKKANDRKAELENIQIVRDMEKGLMEDMKRQVSEMTATITRLDAIIADQAKKIRKYEQKYGELP